MGRGSGLGAIVAVLILALALDTKKLTASAFSQRLVSGPLPGPSFSYSQYVSFVTRPETELEEGEAYEEATTTSGRVGRWLTVNGMIPTPSGGLIAIPRPHVGRPQIDKLLQPIEEAPAYSDEPQDRLDPSTGKMRIDVSARLKPI